VNRYQLYHGDCLDILPTLAAGSIDAVITDPPYGTTACKWDSVIPFDLMWAGIKHVLKPKGAAVLFGSQPFTSALVMSNADWFKYELIWDKVKSSQPHLSKIQPMKKHENVLIFGNAAIAYNPQLEKKRMPRKAYGSKMTAHNPHNLGLKKLPPYFIDCNYPDSVLSFSNADNTNRLHPTQKPVALMEYLIRTYTNEGDTVLDFTMGSGSTGCAAMRTGRRFIGIELDVEYFAIAEQRIKNAAGDFVRTDKEKKAGQMALFEAVQ